MVIAACYPNSRTNCLYLLRLRSKTSLEKLRSDSIQQLWMKMGRYRCDNKYA